MKKIKLLALLMCFGIVSLYSQPKVYLPNFEIIGLHESFQQSASNIFEGYMLKNNKYEVFFDQFGLQDYSTENLQKNAKTQQCEYYVKNSLNALGELIIVNISLYETATNKLVWSDIMKAKNVEDLDPIFYRFSKVIGTEYKASEESDIYDVSEYEANELKRYEANSNFGIFIGGAYTFMNNVENNTSEGFGIILSYDTRDYLLEATGELYFSDINHYSFNIDMLVPVYSKRNTPFFGGGIGFGGTSIEYKERVNYNYYSDYETFTDSKGGLIFQAHAGYLFNRNSNVNLRMTVSPFIGLYEVKDENPVGIKFNVALLFD